MSGTRTPFEPAIRLDLRPEILVPSDAPLSHTATLRLGATYVEGADRQAGATGRAASLR